MVFIRLVRLPFAVLLGLLIGASVAHGQYPKTAQARANSHSSGSMHESKATPIIAKGGQTTAPNGKQLYAEVCLSCHQEDGGGVPGMNPPLTQTSYVLGDKGKLVTILLKGLSGKVNIEGKYYSNIMASQAYLKDDQIAAILTYVRSSFGNSASKITPAEVKAVRATL